MAAVVDIVSGRDASIRGRDASIHVRHGNYPNKSNLALYKPLLHYNNCLKQL